MRMAGEEQDLVGAAELPERQETGAAAAGIEVDEDVVENHGQRIHVVRIFPDQCQPHGKIELLGGAPAQDLRRETDAAGTLDLDFTAIERCDNTGIAALSHDAEKRRSLPQDFRLAFRFVDLSRLVEK